MDQSRGEDLKRNFIMLFILTVMQINSHECVCCANQFILFLLLNLLHKIMLTYCVPVGCVGVSGKDTVVVVCVCAWIPTDSGVYPWGSGRDPVGCIVFSDFVRSRYCALTDV